MVKEDQICSVNRESEVDVMKQLLKTESVLTAGFCIGIMGPQHSLAF